MRILAALVLSLFFIHGTAQKKAAFVSGKVIGENENQLAKVSVVILGKTVGIITNDSGYFRIKVPADKSIALVFSHTGYAETQKNFFLSENEEEKITIRLERVGKILETVVVSDERERKESGLIKINPKNALALPSTVGGVEGLIKTLVGSNNELTSQYSVRGGNYDENLIYINDFEIFRPYLVRSGQQEGLSFINPEMTKNINFYNGGFQAKYGDKMSSVLDIQYKKPKDFGGSVYISLLEQGLHLEGSAKKQKLTYLFGVRNRSNRNLLSSQQTKGAYIPSSTDIQGYFTYQVSEKLQIELLTNFSTTKFTLIPESAEKPLQYFHLYLQLILASIYFLKGRKEALTKPV